MMVKIRSSPGTGFKPPRIESEDDLARGVRALRRACPIMREIHKTTGLPPLRRRPGGFEGLARIVVGQQLSISSAAAIWGRVSELGQPLTAAILAEASDDRLKACGLSRPKIRTLRAVTDAVVSGALDLPALDAMTEDEVHAALTAVHGIGPWTADVYIMFCLGRADAFAGGDLALQVAAQHAIGLDARPSAAELTAMAERWRPWRAAAACLLWAYYPHIRKAGVAGQSAAPV